MGQLFPRGQEKVVDRVNYCLFFQSNYHKQAWVI